MHPSLRDGRNFWYTTHQSWSMPAMHTLHNTNTTHNMYICLHVYYRTSILHIHVYNNIHHTVYALQNLQNYRYMYEYSISTYIHIHLYICTCMYVYVMKSEKTNHLAINFGGSTNFTWIALNLVISSLCFKCEKYITIAQPFDECLDLTLLKLIFLFSGHVAFNN